MKNSRRIRQYRRWGRSCEGLGEARALEHPAAVDGARDLEDKVPYPL